LIYCVFGLGNIGLLTSFFLRKENLFAISRRASECRETRMRIYFLSSGEESFSLNICSLETSVRCDVAIFSSKAYEVKDYIMGFKGRFDEAYCLQNGYGVWEEVKPYSTLNKAFPAPVTYGVKTRNGEIVVTGEGVYYLGGFRGEEPVHLDSLAKALINGGARVQVVNDVEPYVWQKLLVNSVTNPLTAVLKVPNGYLLKNKYLWKIAEEVIREVTDVARREGITFPEDPVIFVKRVLEATSSNYSSMLQDVMRGRKTEIEYINGFIIRKASEHGVNVPFNLILYYLVKSLENIISEVA
jgi:2-dehydropantoate 2-reductase